MIIAGFESRFYDDQDLMNAGRTTIEFDESMDVPLTEQPPPPPPKAIKNVPIITVDEIDEVEDDIEINPDIEMTKDLTIEKAVDIEIIEVEEDTEEILLIVEQTPVPNGGMAAFYKQVSDNIVYPTQAQVLRIEGSVFVQFVVGKDGKLTDEEVIRGIGGGCYDEAI